MKNTKIIIIAASLVLAAALALCGCMYLIGEPPEETQRYDNDEMSVPSVIEETPTAQSEMQKKFAAYGEEEVGTNGEKIFHLFTKEQIDASLQMRKEGKRTSLTYEEIIFIINDTVRIYLEYDQVVMTDFAEHTQDVTRMLYHSDKSSDSAEKASLVSSQLGFLNMRKEYEKCSGDHDYEFMTIATYHGDFSEYDTYESAFYAYNKMITQIEMMIGERLRILDTGTLCYCAVNGHSAYNEHMYGILLDNGTCEDYASYESAFENCLLINDGQSYTRLIGSSKYNAYTPSFESYIFYTENNKFSQVFPTSELETLRPKAAVHLSYATGNGMVATPRKTVDIDFDRWNNRVDITVVTKAQSYVEEHYSGTYKTKGNLLILTLDNGTEVVIKYDGENYSFVEAVRADGLIIGRSQEVVFSFKNDEPFRYRPREYDFNEIFENVIRNKVQDITP